MLTEKQINKWINSYQIFTLIYPESLEEDGGPIRHVCCNSWALRDHIPCPFCGAQKHKYYHFEMDPQNNTFRCSKDEKLVSTIDFVMRFFKFSREEAVVWVNGLLEREKE